MKKWTRAMYQPALGLGKNGTRVTGCKEHILLSKEAAKEGMVLLRNEKDVLPLAVGTNVALFGKATIDYVKGGGGSGDVYCSYVHNLYDGMKQCEQKGLVHVFDPLCEFYEENVKAQYKNKTMPGMTVEPEVPQDLLQQAKAFTDTAIISICRYSGEEWDRKNESTDDVVYTQYSEPFIKASDAVFDRGDFYLTNAEQQMVEAVTSNFAKVIVVLNVGGMVDVNWFYENDAISSVLLGWQAGMEGGLAEAELLCGLASPSGRLTDTFAKTLDCYPSTETFHKNHEYAEYVEDVYVGYRYFETIPKADERVCYPFGYGLSYTNFNVEVKELFTDLGQEGVVDDLAKEDIVKDIITVRVKVTNMGEYAGKEVLQLYYGAPQGLLGKPKKELGAFVKTRLLQPGESQIVTLRIPVAQMASFDEEGSIQKSAYVLEKGCYRIYLGENVREAQEIMVYKLQEEDIVVMQLSPKCSPHRLSEKMNAKGEMIPTNVDVYPEDSCVLQRQPISELEGVIPDVVEEPLRQPISWEQFYSEKQLQQVADGEITLDEFMEQFTIEELIHLTCGHRGTGVTNTGSMGDIRKYGVPAINCADGPAGLRILPECQTPTTAFPCATLLAATWNEDLVEKVGCAGAKEVKENNIGLWLTPAMNIHRSPLCGRNFEYYSEDPFLTGKMGAAMVKGIQSQHVGASVKHFACNNKETYRKDSDSIVSERAMREIYLKAFEIVVKEAKPWTIMTSYNRINGVRASESKELVTDILRGEWGFDGMVTSDWWNHSEHYLEIKAGNDIKMMNGYRDRVKQAYELGAISKEEIKTSARRVLEMILKQD